MTGELTLSAGSAGGGGAGSPIGLCRVSLSIMLLWAALRISNLFRFGCFKSKGHI